VTRAEVDALCATHPGAILAGPGELDAWKVGGKMFACFSGEAATPSAPTEGATGFSVKCADVETAAMLIDAGVATRAPYFHRSWVRLPFADLTPDEAAHRIAVSYDTIRAGLPKRVREAL
jgi:predicted DNA-binding protein (MmcQ/YjbR family)